MYRCRASFCTLLAAGLTAASVTWSQAPSQPTQQPRIRVLPSSPSAPAITTPVVPSQPATGATLSNSNTSSPLGPTAIGPAENYAVYKHVDERGRVTYTNFPVKGAQRLDLEPLNVLPLRTPQTGAAGNAPPGAGTAAASVPGTTLRASTGLSTNGPQPPNRNVAVVTVPAVDRDTQKKRDDDRRKILENELAQEEKSLALAQGLLDAEVKNGEALQKTMAEMAAANITSTDVKRNADKIQERQRSLQLTITEHQRNLDALRKELTALR